MNASLASQTEFARQPEPSAAVARFLKRGRRLLIGGEWVESKSRDTIGVIDPATGREIALVADAHEESVDDGDREREAEGDGGACHLGAPQR